jgi:hypothetical protein
MCWLPNAAECNARLIGKYFINCRRRQNVYFSSGFGGKGLLQKGRLAIDDLPSKFGGLALLGGKIERASKMAKSR